MSTARPPTGDIGVLSSLERYRATNTLVKGGIVGHITNEARLTEPKWYGTPLYRRALLLCSRCGFVFQVRNLQCYNCYTERCVVEMKLSFIYLVEICVCLSTRSLNVPWCGWTSLSLDNIEFEKLVFVEVMCVLARCLMWRRVIRYR